MYLSLLFTRLLSLLLLAVGCCSTGQAKPVLGELTTLTVGPYVSDANSALRGPYQAGPLVVTQTYRNTSAVLQDSLAFTVQAFGPGYSQGLIQFFGALKGLGANGGQDNYVLGDIALPGTGSYLVQTDVFIYDRARKEWVAGPSRVYWLLATTPTPLPVELVSFTAQAQPDSVAISWQTASERNCFGFWLERSTDGLAFAPLHFTAGAGTTSTLRGYQVRDVLPQLATHYYRLRQVDVGGAQQYSPVVAVAPARRTTPVATVYPSPASGQAHVTGAAGGTPVRLYDSTGRLSRQQCLDKEGLLDLCGLPASTYQVVIGEGVNAQRLRLATY
jgi:hypothetical protein